MSMILGLRMLSDLNIARVLADPPLIWQLIAPDDPDVYEQARTQAAANPGLFQRLFGRAQSTFEMPALLQLSPEEGVAADLDKAWHGLYYLLTQTSSGGKSPLNFLVAGGREVGDLDVGYGPARVFTAAETLSIHDALAGLSDETLQARFDPAAMSRAEIYPEIWSVPPEEDDALGYLMGGLDTLRGVLATATGAHLGLVVYLS